jgi:ArsR family transcriptional regulator, arsenate/arsenite/antimonite-responsive transcriptional repressor
MMQEPDRARIQRCFFSPEGRLKQIPVKQAKLKAVLELLAEEFTPGQSYPEKVVNETLLRFHDDFCTLRRNLVDYRLLDRENSQYWRRPSHQ